jgi:hypothetical protein
VALGDALALLLAGAALGALAVAVAAAVRGRPTAGLGRSPSGTAADRLTAAWSLAELGERPAPPLLVARELEAPGLEVPAGSRVVVSGRAHPVVLRSCQVRRAEGPLPVEAAVSAGGRRALLFPSGVRPGALALAVAEPALAARLAALAEAAWASAVPYVERRALADLAGEPGLPVEAEGLLAQVVARPGAAGVLLRLEDGGHSAAVHAARDDGLAGRRVRVQGRLARDAGGYPVVEADRVVAID